MGRFGHLVCPAATPGWWWCLNSEGNALAEYVYTFLDLCGILLRPNGWTMVASIEGSARPRVGR